LSLTLQLSGDAEPVQVTVPTPVREPFTVTVRPPVGAVAPSETVHWPEPTIEQFVAASKITADEILQPLQPPGTRQWV